MDSISHGSGAGPDLKRTRRQRKPHDQVVQVDRLPPHSNGMEMGVLGCVLILPNESMDTCMVKNKHGKEAFYDMRHQTIYEAMEDMYLNRQPIDIITLQQKLKDKGLLDQVGGIPYLSQLQDAVPSAANLDYYLDGMRDKFLLRKVVSICTNVVGKVYDYCGEVDQLVDEVERDILAIRGGNMADEIMSPKDLVGKAIGEIEFVHTNAGKIIGLSTGFPDIDHYTDGMHGGELIVIAAYPGTGKSALAMNIAVHNAVHQKVPCGFLTAEMKPVKLMVRNICSESRVNLMHIRDHFITEDAFPKMTSAAGRLANSPLYIHSVSGHSIGQVIAMGRRMKQKYGIKLLVMDYLQLLHAKADSREREIAAISQGLKELSMELDIPVIALSQLNDDGKLRESRAPGQDAHSVWKLMPAGSDPDYTEEQDATRIKVHIGKNREGPAPVEVDLTFLKCYTRFESAAKISDQDLPPQ